MHEIWKGLPGSEQLKVDLSEGGKQAKFTDSRQLKRRRIADKQACCITYTLEGEPLDQCLATSGTTNVEPEPINFHDLPYPCYFCQDLGWDR